MPIKHAVIAGAGIAGLTAALALARRGISSAISEQATELAEVGAGLQLSPNASRLLGELGVLSEIEKHWLEPQSIRLVAGDTLRPLAAVPAGDFARERWRAPYGVLHRATLQRVLLDAVRANPLCSLDLGTAFDAERSSSADVMIGADGVWSKTRARVTGAPFARFSGNIAYRFEIARSSAPAFLDGENVTAFLGPSAHLVCYPLKETRTFNLVAITSGSESAPTWAADAHLHLETLRKRFAGWHSGFTSLLGDIRPTFWPLYEASEGRWQNGRDCVLIGDAAHAMMPFAAQGAAMAIEDAYELANLLATEPLERALPRFEEQRAQRVTKIRKRGAFNRFAYHARGPIRIGRDIVLSLKPPQSLAADLDWIYGYRPSG